MTTVDAAPVWQGHAEFERARYRDPTNCEGQLHIVEQGRTLWILECDACGFDAGLPAAQADPRFKAKSNLERGGFPVRFIDTPFNEDRHNAPALKALRAWSEQFKSGPIPAPAIYGEPGRGKTHLLVATCKRIVTVHSRAVMFRSVAKLLDELQSSFDDPSHNRKTWEQALTVDILALDDIGAEQGTEWRQDRLARLVDERYENERPILLATNFTPESWSRSMDERTASRLAGMTFPVHLQGPDRRAQKLPGVA